MSVSTPTISFSETSYFLVVIYQVFSFFQTFLVVLLFSAFFAGLTGVSAFFLLIVSVSSRSGKP